jgi:hypothetical protein
MNSQSDDLQLVLDREISSENADAFGHRDFAAALRSIIESPHHEPPYSVGLLGKWGSGKSSVKTMYLSSLRDDVSKDKDGRVRCHSIFPITFNAWRFGGEDIKRALLRHVYLCLGGDSQFLTDALFKKIQETIQTPRPWREILRDIFDRWIWGPLLFLIVLSSILGMLYFAAKIFSVDNAWAAAAIIVVSTCIAKEVFKHLFSPHRLFIPRYSNIVRVDEPRSSAEEYEDLLIAQFKEFKKRKGGDCTRVVVFVDDLDRLSAEEMVGGLDAVRTFLEIPDKQLPENLGLIFVISCDEDRVADALAGRTRQTRGNPDLPATVSDKSSARRYLDRIFQFRLEIPDCPKLDMRNFALQRLSIDFPDVADELIQHNVSIEQVIDRLIHVGVRSPRNAIQVLNAFSQAWWLAKRREREGAGTNRPGGLHEGAITKHPISLAAVCALKVNYPDFYNDLLADIKIRDSFIDVFHAGQPMADLPESARSILGKYADDEGKLRPQHRSLRQYLVSLQGVRWPPTIQPLLLLAQDPVTRRLGDSALPLYEAMVSGDHTELLRLLGRELGSDPISQDDIRIIYGMVEDLDQESEIRRDNAASCLAAIADRIPSADTHRLLNPVARRLISSVELRQRIGISKISQLIRTVSAEDCQDITGRLISDLLKTKDDITFRLPTLQTPSLEEASELTKEACETVLGVRSRHGLREKDDQRLLAWLEDRRVAVSGKEHTFSFDQLESWMGPHEDHLLKLLEHRYSAMAIDAIEREAVDSENLATTLHRCGRVFETLYAAGEEGRSTLWDQLKSMVAVKDQHAVTFSLNAAKGFLSKSNKEQYSKFISSCASRIIRAHSASDEWSLDIKQAGQELIAIISFKSEDVDDSAQGLLANLANQWAKTAETAGYACSIADTLVAVSSEYLTGAMNTWISGISANLPISCVEWVARHFSSTLTDEQRGQLVQTLNGVIAKDKVSEKESECYLAVMKHMEPESLKKDPLSGHLSTLCTHVKNRHNNPRDYLYRVFPVIPIVGRFCPAGDFGAMLHELFNNSKATPPLCGWLHGQMIGHWPKKDSSLHPYDPQQIFNGTVAMISANASAQDMGEALGSAWVMLEENLVEKDREPELARSACALWPHNRSSAHDVFKKLSAPPSPAHVAFLANGVNTDIDGDLADLGRAWSIFAQEDIGFLTEVFAEILKLDVKSADASQSYASTWIELCSARAGEVLNSVLCRNDVTDEQVKRVWAQTMKIRETLSLQWFVEMIPVIIRDDWPHATAYVLDQRSNLSEKLQSKDDRHELGSALLETLLASNSKTNINQIASWIYEIDAEGVLKGLEKRAEEIPEVHIQALRAVFPKSKYLKKSK